MKKFLLTALSIIFALSMIIVIAGCNKSSLAFNKASFDLDVGAKATTVSLLKDGNEVLDFSGITCTSSNSAVVKFEDGRVTPVSLGVATITAESDGVKAKALVSVTKLDGKEATIDAKNEYTVVKEESVSLGYKIKYNGSTYTDAEVTYNVVDSSYGSVTNKVFNATSKYGTVKVKINATWRGIEVDEKTVTIVIEKLPTEDKTGDISYYLDEDGLKLSNEQLIEIFGEVDTIASVKLDAGEQEKASYVNSKITFSGTTPSLDDAYTLVLEGTEKKVAISIFYVTKIIDEGKDMLIFKTSKTGEDDTTTSSSYDRYQLFATFPGVYIVTKDIDCSKVTGFNNMYVTEIAYSLLSNPVGLTGVFDGMGHTISNLKVGMSGLFGFICGGTLRNVAFENLQSSNTVSKGYDSYLAFLVTAESIVENVYCSIPNPAPYTNYVFCRVMTDTALKNVYIEGEIMGAIPFHATLYAGTTMSILYYDNVSALSKVEGLVLISHKPFCYYGHRTDQKKYKYADFEGATPADFPEAQGEGESNAIYNLNNTKIARYCDLTDFYSGYSIYEYGKDAVDSILASEYFDIEKTSSTAKIVWVGNTTK